MQELEAAAMRSTREWEVLQRGTVTLTNLLDKFRADGDAAAYARMLVSTFRGVLAGLCSSVSLGGPVCAICRLCCLCLCYGEPGTYSVIYIIQQRRRVLFVGYQHCKHNSAFTAFVLPD